VLGCVCCVSLDVRPPSHQHHATPWKHGQRHTQLLLALICSSDRRKKQSACRQNRHVYTALTSVYHSVPFICALCVWTGSVLSASFFPHGSSEATRFNRRLSSSPLAKDKKIRSKGSKQWKERHTLGFETTKGTRSNHPAFILINVESEKPTKPCRELPSGYLLTAMPFIFAHACWCGVSQWILLCSYNCFFIF